MPRLRIAAPEDAAAFADVFLKCWRVSYSTVMPSALVERMTVERAGELWRTALAGGDSYVTAESDEGMVIGFVGYRITGPGEGYISSLYVSPYAQGAGYGRLLLARAESDLRELGAATARLWVFEQNEPSRRFYEKLGWNADGTRETREEWGEPQIGMVKSL